MDLGTLDVLHSTGSAELSARRSRGVWPPDSTVEWNRTKMKPRISDGPSAGSPLGGERREVSSKCPDAPRSNVFLYPARRIAAIMRISAVRGIRFGTVASPNVGQRTTFDPDWSLLWESSTLKVIQSSCRPTAVPKWVSLCAVMRSDSYGRHREQFKNAVSPPEQNERLGQSEKRGMQGGLFSLNRVLGVRKF